MNFDSIRAPVAEAPMYSRRRIGNNALHVSWVRSPRRNLSVNANRNIHNTHNRKKHNRIPPREPLEKAMTPAPRYPQFKSKRFPFPVKLDPCPTRMQPP